MKLLEAENITKDYQGHKALNNVSISVPKGSIFGLLGPNGAGKTTLIRIINQITAPDSGSVSFNGHSLKREDVFKIGYLPEERGLYKKMKVGEQALYLAQLKGMSPREAQKTLKYWFDKFEISAWWNKKVEELSKGMAQKVQFITTVLHKPDLLIFDEPFSGFDPINVKLLKEEILKLKEEGSTIIFSTHNMASVEELCDHITLINEAETILEGKIGEVRNKYRSNIINVGVEGSIEEISKKLDKRFEVLSTDENGMTREVRIKIPADSKPNELIQALVPLTEIHSYNELIPSMNDIFIQTVNDASKNGKKL